MQEQTTKEKDNIILLLYQQSDNFIALKSFVIINNITPSVVFLPQTLKLIDSEFSNKLNLVTDCLNYLDVVRLFSLTIHDDADYYLDNINHLLIENRTIEDIRHTLANKTLDDFIFNHKEEATVFLNNNKLLVAIYLFSLIHFVMYSDV